MARDRRWDRIQQASGGVTKNITIDRRSATEVLETFYAQEITDEFIPPTRIAPGAVEPGDAASFQFSPRPCQTAYLCLR